MHKVLKYKLDHLAFWLITLGFYAFTRRHVVETSGWIYFVADVLYRNLLIAGACYFNIFILFRKYFRKGKYLAYGILLLVLLLTYTAAQNVFDAWLNGYIGNDPSKSGFFYNSYYNFSIGLFYIAFTLALQLSKQWYQQQLLIQRIQTEKLQAELLYLKAQLNPHFLFNCINTIYFQIEKENEAARESLQKFSELLRYQLYECNEDAIPIEKETTYLRSYVDLQRLRKGCDNHISFQADPSASGFRIAPLLLLPFVENAFKHLSTYPEQENTIAINLRRENGNFLFNVTNSINPLTADAGPRGIGLKNVKRRLDLLYGNRYTLDLVNDASTFMVNLEIKLS